ncbi:MAG: hypothetical protein K2L77_07750 [Muribaculaceae bacterium]|nr:hypothetical protein [Muribaculaceae bacterium]
MKRLWLFYPENDIALAHGNSNFTAPAAAVALHQAGEALPLWMASDGDYVLCNGINDRWLGEVQTRYGVAAGVWDHRDYACVPVPWGWSAASRKVFENCGFTAGVLPSQKVLDTYRELSHRRTAALFARMIGQELPFVDARAEEVSDIKALSAILADGNPHVVKSPWSSSGRGVHFVIPGRTDEALRQAAGTIRRQGSVMVEPMVCDRLDFAMLYYMECGRARYHGLSVFVTDRSTGRYAGNMVAAPDILASSLAHRVPSDMLAALDRAVSPVLEKLLGQVYEGPVGIDMMADADHRIHIAEINLRYTMGFLSRSLERLVPYGDRYIYEILPGNGVPDGAICLTPPSTVMQFVLRPLHGY